ncbi:MAG: TolC family protein [bacterium]|nr:TolC family protein [bacterium]
MRIKHEHVLAAGFVLLCAVTAGAETAMIETAVIEITWSGIADLVDEHPLLAAGEQGILAARGAVDAAGARPNPTLEAALGRVRERPGEPFGRQWDLSLTLPLDWLSRRSPRLDVARADLDAAAAEHETIRRDVLLELRTQFWNLVHDQRQVVVVEELARETANLASAVGRRVEAGEVRPVEGTQAEIERELVDGELAAARTALASRQAQLALWLGAPPGATIVAVADLEALSEPPDPGAGSGGDISGNIAGQPALRLEAARVRALAAELSAERRERLPAFSLMAYTSRELDQRARGGGIAVDLPLWDWNSGGIARAQAQLAAGLSREEARRRAFAAEIVAAVAACRTSFETASRLAAGVVPRSASAAAVIEKTYLSGETGLLEVIDARRTLLASHRRLLDALAQAQIDHCRLRALIGEELP